MEEEKKKIKVAAYCRVSTLASSQELSYESQKQFFEKKIESNPEYELVHIYADKITATKFHRDDFLKMMDDAGLNVSFSKTGRTVTFEASPREPKFSRILVTNISRFARDILAMDPIRELRKKKVYIDFIDSGRSTENEDDLLLIQLLITFAQQESVDRSEKVRGGLARAADMGRLFENGSLFGYDYKIGENKLEINESEAEIVRTIFNLYTVGVNGEKYGMRRIVDYLTENKMFTRKGKPFVESTIKRILSNNKYCGDLVRNKYDSGIVFEKYPSPKVRDKEEWIIHEGVIPAIITRETFEKAQHIRDGNYHSQQQRGIYKGVSEYAGLLKCYHCGASYVRNVDRGRIFYNCATKKARGTKACNAMNINLSDIEEAVEHFANGGIKETMFNLRDTYIEDLKIMKKALIQKIDNQAYDEAEKIMRQINDLENKKDKLLDLFLSDGFDKATLEKKNRQINQEIDTLRSQVQSLTRTNEDIRNEIAELDKSIEALEKKIDIKEKYEKQELLEYINRVELFSFHSMHNAQTGEVENQKGIIVHIEFKLFEIVNRIVEKYEGIGHFRANKGISYRVYK